MRLHGDDGMQKLWILSDVYFSFRTREKRFGSKQIGSFGLELSSLHCEFCRSLIRARIYRGNSSLHGWKSVLCGMIKRTKNLSASFVASTDKSQLIGKERHDPFTMSYSSLIYSWIFIRKSISKDFHNEIEYFHWIKKWRTPLSIYGFSCFSRVQESIRFELLICEMTITWLVCLVGEIVENNSLLESYS